MNSSISILEVVLSAAKNGDLMGLPMFGSLFSRFTYLESYIESQVGLLPLVIAEINDFSSRFFDIFCHFFALLIYTSEETKF